MSSNLRLKALVVAMGLAAGSAAFAAAPSAVLANTTSVTRATALDAGDSITGPMALTQSMRVTMSLKLRNKAQLDAFIANPHHKNLTHAQVMAKYGPTAAQVEQVKAFMRQQGFGNINVSGDNMLVSGEAPVATVQSAFHTTMVNVRTYDGRLAFANATDASVPSSLTGIVHEVIGLQNVHRFHVLKPTHHVEASGTQYYEHNPVDFQSIYDAGSTATGSTIPVGVITSGSVTQTQTDFSNFLKANPSLGSIPINVVKVDSPGTAKSGTTEWDIDTQDIAGISGGVKALYLYDTKSLSTQDLVDDFSAAESANVVRIVNVSIGGCETGGDTNNVPGEGLATGDNVFALADAEGMTFSIATGDSGAEECGTKRKPAIGVSWPADSEYVVAVGGTSLYTSGSSNNVYASESVWSGSGGGVSTFEAQPSWQNGVGTNAGSSYRGLPDVVMEGDPDSGVTLYLKGSTQSGWGGTSLASPLFVGVWARTLATNPGLSFAAPLIYADAASNYATDFHDITSGNNGGETAATGWDYASGFGSIDIANFVSHMTTSNIPTASFNISTTGLTAAFTDASSDSGAIGMYHWNFGDGHTNTGSTLADPSHTYAAAGTYNVTETVTDASDSSVQTKITKQVTVSGGSVADFSYTATGLQASFIDTSSNSGAITSYKWNFGDGHTTSGASIADPSHTYASAGTYNVTETVYNGSSSNHITEQVTVAAGPVASFSYAAEGLTASFTDASTDGSGTISTYHWNFGDGHTTTGANANPSHTYAAAGTYNVTETVSDGSSSSHITAPVSVSVP